MAYLKFDNKRRQTTLVDLGRCVLRPSADKMQPETATNPTELGAAELHGSGAAPYASANRSDDNNLNGKFVEHLNKVSIDWLLLRNGIDEGDVNDFVVA